MRSDRMTKLLSAYVDGELNAKQKRAVHRLLRGSSEARWLLDELQGDARALRTLPIQRPNENFAERVMAAVQGAPAPDAPSRFLAYASLAAAACVLLAVGTSSYLYFSGGPHSTSVVMNEDEDDSDEVVKVPDKSGGTTKPPETKPRRPKPKPTTTQIVTGPPATERKPPPDPTPTDPKPTEPKSTELARPIPTMDRFDLVNPRFALTAPVRDLVQDRDRNQLRDELRKDNAFRIELLTQGNGRAFERLQAACGSQGVKLHVDAVAQARLKNKKVATDYTILIEGLTAEECAALLEQVGRDDKNAESKRAGEGAFGKYVLLPLTGGDHEELAKLMGVDTKRLDRPAPARSDAAKMPNTKQGLVLSYNPVRPDPAGSKEIKAFLDARKDRRPGTLQILLVLRGPG